jgi:hypothetical protein
MADWYGSARSNYFKVEDEAGFEEFLKTLPDVTFQRAEGGLFALFSDNEYGGWPAYIWIQDDAQDFDLISAVAPWLAEDSVAVFMEVGAEKLRYLTGWAVAVNKKGQQVMVSIDDIYDKAKEAFGVQPSPASWTAVS